MTTNTITNSNLINKLLIGLIILLSIIIMWLTFKGGTTPLPPDPGTIIVRQVKEVSELTTAMFETETVIDVVSDKEYVFKIPRPDSKLLYIAHGNVRVGVNLSQFNTDNIKINDQNITVTLPPLKVLDSKLDLEHSKVYSYDRGFLGLGPDVVTLQRKAQLDAVKKIKEAACEDWLIDIASERVEKTVDHLLSEILKDYTVTVNISEGSCVQS